MDLDIGLTSSTYIHVGKFFNSFNTGKNNTNARPLLKEW